MAKAKRKPTPRGERGEGREPLIKDLELLKRAMHWGPYAVDVAALFNCSKRTVEMTISREFGMTFTEFREFHMATTRKKLVERALDLALDNQNPSEKMLIHCLNNLCGWNAGNNASSTVVQVKAEAIANSETEKKMVQEFKEAVAGYLGERKE